MCGGAELCLIGMRTNQVKLMSSVSAVMNSLSLGNGCVIAGYFIIPRESREALH